MHYPYETITLMKPSLKGYEEGVFPCIALSSRTLHRKLKRDMEHYAELFQTFQDTVDDIYNVYATLYTRVDDLDFPDTHPAAKYFSEDIVPWVLPALQFKSMEELQNCRFVGDDSFENNGGVEQYCNENNEDDGDSWWNLAVRSVSEL